MEISLKQIDSLLYLFLIFSPQTLGADDLQGTAFLILSWHWLIYHHCLLLLSCNHCIILELGEQSVFNRFNRVLWKRKQTFLSDDVAGMDFSLVSSYGTHWLIELN